MNIRPCPFCGNKATQIFSINSESTESYVYGCFTIGCMGNALRGRWHYKTDKEAIEAWNKRANDTEVYKKEEK